MTNEKLLLLEDICPILHIGKTTAYRLIQSGQLPAQKIGGKWQIKTDDFRDYLAGKFSRNENRKGQLQNPETTNLKPAQTSLASTANIF